MIKLQIESYCENCPEFEVEQDTTTLNSIGFCEAVHTLSCEHAEKCKNLFNYIWGEKQ